jgi:protein-S-isoprenylcysteine O-methyltransferase Ste14
MAYQFSKRHRTTFQILGTILLLLFFFAVLVPLLGPSIISILTVVAVIVIIAVIVGKRGT